MHNLALIIIQPATNESNPVIQRKAFYKNQDKFFAISLLIAAFHILYRHTKLTLELNLLTDLYNIKFVLLNHSGISLIKTSDKPLGEQKKGRNLC